MNKAGEKEKINTYKCGICLFLAPTGAPGVQADLGSLCVNLSGTLWIQAFLKG